MSWHEFFEKKSVQKELDHIVEKLLNTPVYYPQPKHIFRAFDACPAKRLKVVLLGQDPYHGVDNNGRPQATGLSFSIADNNFTLPPSLRNIFKELRDDLPESCHTNGDLSNWSKQGVFLYNTALTVEPGKPQSHKSLWEGFTYLVVEYINAIAEQQGHKIVWILLGSNAKFYTKYINADRSIIITAAHPSPLSADKGFFGSKIFSRCNTELDAIGLKPIQW